MMESYFGYIGSTMDAILLIEACRQGILQRLQRRLTERERSTITHGSVFIWNEHESKMRRWTDGRAWSASRASGQFLLYREMEEGCKNSEDKWKWKVSSAERSFSPTLMSGTEGTESFTFKQDGLLKQSFSITLSKTERLHLISYCSTRYAEVAALPCPTTDPRLSAVRIPMELYPVDYENAQLFQMPKLLLQNAQNAQMNTTPVFLATPPPTNSLPVYPRDANDQYQQSQLIHHQLHEWPSRLLDHLPQKLLHFQTVYPNNERVAPSTYPPRALNNKQPENDSMAETRPNLPELIRSKSNTGSPSSSTLSEGSQQSSPDFSTSPSLTSPGKPQLPPLINRRHDWGDRIISPLWAEDGKALNLLDREFMIGMHCRTGK